MWKRLVEAIIFRIQHGPCALGPTPLPPFEIAKLDLKAGDYLLLRFRERLSQQQVECLTETIGKMMLLPKGRIMVLEGNADLAVITPPPPETVASLAAA
jgi:hypothetical protein